MPGAGYVLGGLIAAGYGPRATFLVAGIGVVAIVIVTAPLLRTRWPEAGAQPALDERSSALDGGGEILLQLIPAGRSRRPEGESHPQSEPEVKS
jgi:hypothetical protein